MEQINNIVLGQQPLNFLQNKCKSLILKKLSTLSGAHLTIDDGFSQHQLGDELSSVAATMHVADPQTYVNIVRGGSIAAAEDYIDGKWGSPDLTKLIRVFAIAQDKMDTIEAKQNWLTKFKNALFHRGNKNTLKQAKNNILAHYDLGNALYQKFLDDNMVYSSAIFEHPQQSLEQAQLNKFELICQRLDLKATDSVVEIGTGWGGLAMYIAEQYGCQVTTTTISDEQYQYVQQQLKKRGLLHKVVLLNKDYRELTGQYDKLVSIEMIEAVGKEYFEQFFKQCHKLLKVGGKSLIQSITIADYRYHHYSNNVDFIQKYIFPGGCLPSVTVLNQNMAEHTSLVPESLYDFGYDYARTLNLWRERFTRAWQDINKLGYDQRFYRLWHYYLCYCEGAFMENKVSCVHLVANKR